MTDGKGETTEGSSMSSEREWQESLNARLTRQDEMLETLSQRMELNETAIDGLGKDTKELVDFFKSMVGAFNVFNMIGKLAKPVGTIAGMAAAIGSLWLMIRGGGK
jgi:hypothetical protein